MSTGGRTWTTAQIRRATGATARQIDYWLRSGYVPHPDPTPGSGRARHLTLEQVVQIGMLADLKAAGIEPSGLGHRQLTALQRAGTVRLGSVVLTYDAAAHRADIVRRLEEAS